MDRNRKRTKTTLQMKLTEQDKKEIRFLAVTAFKVYIGLLLTLTIMYICLI
jgi:hypothetical protein